MSVDNIIVVMSVLVHLMILPQRIHEECLHSRLLLHMNGVDGIQQIGVVEHHLRRLLGEVLAHRIDHVQQAGISQILDVIHDCSTRCLDILCQLADIGCLRTAVCQLLEQLLNLRQVFQLNLFNEQDVYLGHHIHGLQQVLAIVALFLEERVEAVVDIVLEIAVGRHLGQNLLDDALVVLQDFFERVGAE